MVSVFAFPVFLLGGASFREAPARGGCLANGSRSPQGLAVTYEASLRSAPQWAAPWLLTGGESSAIPASNPAVERDRRQAPLAGPLRGFAAPAAPHLPR